MKGIIIYKGKYDTTKQYAGWISTALGIPAVVSDHISGENLSAYDFVVLGSSVYIGKLLIRDWLNQNVSALMNKKIFMFIVCGTPAEEKEAREKILSDNLSGEIRNKSDIYFLPGRVIRKNLSITDRWLLMIGSLMVKDKEARKRMRKDFDGVKAGNILPLLTAIKASVSGQQADSKLSDATLQIL
ncbi:MAG TPA: flavodoxin domain-containing protein [Puia sp.]|nr:flavodoxin domain-containing protein [Puia sp.]